MDALPLLPESNPDAIVAYCGAQAVSQRQFLDDVFALAEHLPEVGHLINLCKNRYRFAVALLAGVVRGQLSVLPHTVAPEILAGLKRAFSDLVCVSDQPCAPHALPHIYVQEYLGGSGAAPALVPRIPADREILYVYTSGSTGTPQQHVKTLGQMHQCCVAEAKRMWAFAGAPCTVLGTVPFQHMYGLESTVFLPLFGGGRLSSPLPFFPADVASALADLSGPRLLVTTPFHLRKLLDTQIEYPAVAAVLSATAPLSAALAAEAEARLNAPVVEIYGSTEAGQLATRRPTRETQWDLYDGIELEIGDDTAVAHGGHLRAPEVLNDVIELCGQSRFRLLGRRSDVVNVAGKRSSLAYLNQVITAVPGVRDGVFCIPESRSEHDVGRLAAFLVAPGLTARHIQAALLQTLDPVFLPRPIIFLDALPRDGNGKLPAAALAELIARHIP